MRCHAVVPAAGAGKRFGAGIPKQYLLLAGRSIQQHTLDRLSAMPELASVAVAVAPDDELAVGLAYAQPQRLRFVVGGRERMDSVLAGIEALRAVGAVDDDWVLVHDVARPLLRPADVRLLLATLDGQAVGGLLASPVRDTMKRGDASGLVLDTVPREQLWHALTPQMFPIGTLKRALEEGLALGAAITDEASAMERAGFPVRMVEGRADNIKVTRPEDLEWLRQRWAGRR